MSLWQRFYGRNMLMLFAGFVAFDAYKTLLEDEKGQISGPRTVIAGFGAGITESLLAVTPFESIKTQLCASCFPLYHLASNEHSLRSTFPLESTIANPPTHECVAFCTAPLSSSVKKACEDSSKASCQQRPVKPQTQPSDLEATLR